MRLGGHSLSKLTISCQASHFANLSCIAPAWYLKLGCKLLVGKIIIIISVKLHRCNAQVMLKCTTEIGTCIPWTLNPSTLLFAPQGIDWLKGDFRYGNIKMQKLKLEIQDEAWKKIKKQESCLKKKKKECLFLPPYYSWSRQPLVGKMSRFWKQTLLGHHTWYTWLNLNH